MKLVTISDPEGSILVRHARSAIEACVSGRPLPRWSEGFMSVSRGVFVTLNRVEPIPDRLRGCIGFPFPSKKLGDALIAAAAAAATEDPRFPPVTPSELEAIVVEVSVLTSPEELNVPRRDLPTHVRIGQDGLIVSRSYESGLLLPQVATEFRMDEVQFLSEACVKAGLPPDSWLDPLTKVQVFQAEIFAEIDPGGRVVRMVGNKK